MKGNDRCFIVWAMEVMHATLEGSSNEGIWAIGHKVVCSTTSLIWMLDTTEL
jgi:hypothetical protein